MSNPSPPLAREPLHYCGHPDNRAEPTLCGINRQDDGQATRTTTVGADTTCPDCLDVLEGRKP